MTSFHYTLEVLTWYLPCSVSLTDFEMNERKMGEYHPVKNSIVPTEKKKWENWGMTFYLPTEESILIVPPENSDNILKSRLFPIHFATKTPLWYMFPENSDVCCPFLIRILISWFKIFI